MNMRYFTALALLCMAVHGISAMSPLKMAELKKDINDEIEKVRTSLSIDEATDSHAKADKLIKKLARYQEVTTFNNNLSKAYNTVMVDRLNEETVNLAGQIGRAGKIMRSASDFPTIAKNIQKPMNDFRKKIELLDASYLANNKGMAKNLEKSIKGIAGLIETNYMTPLLPAKPQDRDAVLRALTDFTNMVQALYDTAMTYNVIAKNDTAAKAFSESWNRQIAGL